MSDPFAETIQIALSKTPYACSKLTRLSGGNANFTYRGYLLDRPDETIIIKHAEDYVARNPEWKLDIERAV